MTYPAGEALVLTILKKATGFDSTNTRRGDWGVLASGKSKQYAIIRPSVATREFHTLTMAMGQWNTQIEVFRRYKADEDSLTDLETHVSNIITEFDKAQRLGDTNDAVLDSMVVEAGEPLEQQRRKIKWLMIPLTVEWTEETSVTFSD